MQPEVPSGAGRSAATLAAGSIVAAALASFCCILPIVFVLSGVAVVGAAAVFAAWRPYLLALTLALLGLAFYFAYRAPSRACEPGTICAVPGSRRRLRGALWLSAAIVLVLAAFPYFSATVAGWLL